MDLKIRERWDADSSAARRKRKQRGLRALGAVGADPFVAGQPRRSHLRANGSKHGATARLIGWEGERDWKERRSSSEHPTMRGSCKPLGTFAGRPRHSPGLKGAMTWRGTSRRLHYRSRFSACQCRSAAYDDRSLPRACRRSPLPSGRSYIGFQPSLCPRG